MREHWVSEAVESAVTRRLPQKPSRCGVGECMRGVSRRLHMLQEEVVFSATVKQASFVPNLMFSQRVWKTLNTYCKALRAVINLPVRVISLYFNGCCRLSTGNSFIGGGPLHQRTSTYERILLGKVSSHFQSSAVFEKRGEMTLGVPTCLQMPPHFHPRVSACCTNLELPSPFFSHPLSSSSPLSVVKLGRRGMRGGASADCPPPIR